MNNSLFKSPQDEETICKVLKAYVEEHGAEAITVLVPKRWREYSNNHSLGGRINLLFSLDNSVCIQASSLQYSCNFIMELA